MEKKVKEHIGFLRAKFNKQGLDVDKLVAILKRDQLLPHDRVAAIEEQTTNAAKMDRLLDEIVSAKDSTYQKLLRAVEQCVPPAASPVLLTPPPYPYSHGHRNAAPSTESCSASLTSDSEDDGIRVRASSLTDGHGKELPGGYGKLSNILNTRQHDHSASSSFLALSDRYSPLPIVDDRFSDRHSPLECTRKQMSSDNRLDWFHIKLKKLREEEQQEMSELRAQHHKAIAALSGSGAGNSEVSMTDLYHASLQKYEILHKDYDIMRERYAELKAQHSSACCQLEAMVDIQKQLDEMRRDRDSIMRDKIAFQQHSTTVIQNLEQMIHENRKLKVALENLQREHDSCSKDQRQLQAKQVQLQKDCNFAVSERDAVIMEYRQVMSEREVVHKEIEQLQDKLTDMNKLLDKYTKEKSATEGEIEHLKQELAASAASQEKYRQVSEEAMELRGQLEAERVEHERELQLMEQQRDIARKERHQALEQMDILIKETYEKTQKEKAEEMDQVSKETELLKKEIDKMRLELTDAEKEAITATKRRDWAFSEIDKTVQERESIRTLCDNLRRERDRAVSKLAKALRNSDECEKQKNDAVKELKKLREKYEALVERDARRQQLNSVGHNHSHDSAIDADLQEWETETLEIELDGGDGHNIGFDIVGGNESPLFPGDNTLFISHVTKGGIAEGKLRVNDQLLKVNDLDATNVERYRVEQALTRHSRSLTLVVRRRKFAAARVWQPLQLFVSFQKEGCIEIEQGLFISRIHPGRVIGKDGYLPSSGDRIISINHQPTENLSAQEALQMLEQSSQPVVLGVLHQVSPLSSTGSSPTPTSTSVLSTLPEHFTPSQVQSAAVSKSDTLDTHNNLWDSISGDSARSAAGSSKNLRSSGSQTDSLDSPGPSPPKSLRNHGHEKIRHSMPVLDMVVGTIFRLHNKNDCDCDTDTPHSKNDVCERGHKKDKDRERKSCGLVSNSEDSELPGIAGGVSSVTQTPLRETDDVIVEFPPSAFVPTSPNAGCKTRKQDLEAESSSGTWPKSRTGLVISSNVPSTVTCTPAKERPSIKDPCFFQPPAQQGTESTDRSGGTQMIPNDLMKGPVSVSQPFIPSSKEPPHFSVRVSQGPSLAVVHPTFPKQWPGHGPASQQSRAFQSPRLQTYPNPQPLHPPPRFQTGPPALTAPPPFVPRSSSSVSTHPATFHPQLVTPRATVRSVRPAFPLSRDQLADKWHLAPSWPYHLGPPPHPQSLSPKSLSPEGGTRTARPVSLEVPYPVRFRDMPREEMRVGSPVGMPVGTGLSGRSAHYFTHHPNPVVSSSGSQHTARPLVMNAGDSSPLGVFNAISPQLESDQAMFHPVLPAHSLRDHYSSPTPSQQSFAGVDCVTPTPSEDFGPPRYIHPGSTSPRGRPLSEIELRHMSPTVYAKHDKLQERIWIPSSSSFTTRSGSVEIVSGGSSPVSPSFHFDGSESSKGKRFSMSSSRDEYLYSPRHHEIRTITFEKSCEPVGFQIQGGPAGGIFVSAVNDNSLAAQAGLVIGHQLLEVCGINMRNATHEHALTVLRQCGDNLIMKVQYNPEKYMDDVDSASTITAMSSVATSPTHSKLSSGDSGQSTPKHHTPQHSKSNSSGDGTYERPHVVHFKRHKGENGPGFTIIGGNAVGIFVHEIQSDTAASSVLQRGDMILEYNDISFQSLTAEQAMLELKKPCSTMRMTVLNSVSKYSKAQTIPGDRFFIRANFSRTTEGDGELDFHKDDILLVENTVHRGTQGLWLAWLVDEQGKKVRCGSIPSRFRLEDEIVLRRSHSENLSLGDTEDLKGSRRGLGSARRSFFRRRRHHHSNSRDSGGSSFSDASLNSESVPILDESVMGYTQVQRIEYEQTRPVVLLAPLADPLIRKLVSESPDKYSFCEPSMARGLMKDMNQGLAEGRLVDFWKKEDHFECIHVNHIRDMCDQKVHCLLNVNPQAIERLHRLKMFPIVIFVRHKSHKQIKEIRDAQFLPEKLQSKTAKDLFDHFSKMEHDCSHLFSSLVQGGNLAEMSTHIKAAIDSEQKKAIWVSVS